MNSGEVHLRAIAVSTGHSESEEAEGIYLVSPDAQGAATPKPSPSSPQQPQSAEPQTAKGQSGPPPERTEQAAPKLPRTPSADRGRGGNTTTQMQPTQQPQKATNPIQSAPEATPVQMQEISATEAESMIISRTMPVYPAAAQARGVSGTVILNIVISTSGSVSKIDPVSGPPELQQAAIHAVRAWRYRPYYIQGRAVPVATAVRMTFNLR